MNNLASVLQQRLQPRRPEPREQGPVPCPGRDHPLPPTEAALGAVRNQHGTVVPWPSRSGQPPAAEGAQSCGNSVCHPLLCVGWPSGTRYVPMRRTAHPCSHAPCGCQHFWEACACPRCLQIWVQCQRWVAAQRAALRQVIQEGHSERTSEPEWPQAHAVRSSPRGLSQSVLRITPEVAACYLRVTDEGAGPDSPCSLALQSRDLTHTPSPLTVSRSLSSGTAPEKGPALGLPGSGHLAVRPSKQSWQTRQEGRLSAQPQAAHRREQGS